MQPNVQNLDIGERSQMTSSSLEKMTGGGGGGAGVGLKMTSFQTI